MCPKNALNISEHFGLSTVLAAAEIVVFLNTCRIVKYCLDHQEVGHWNIMEGRMVCLKNHSEAFNVTSNALGRCIRTTSLKYELPTTQET